VANTAAAKSMVIKKQCCSSAFFWSAYGGRESKFSEGTVLLWFVSARMAFGGTKKKSKTCILAFNMQKFFMKKKNQKMLLEQNNDFL
jgi:hypothetical protein